MLIDKMYLLKNKPTHFAVIDDVIGVDIILRHYIIRVDIISSRHVHVRIQLFVVLRWLGNPIHICIHVIVPWWLGNIHVCV